MQQQRPNAAKNKKKRPQLETRKLSMVKLTSKSKHTYLSTHKYDIKTSNPGQRRIKMWDIGNAFEIKRPAT